MGPFQRENIATGHAQIGGVTDPPLPWWASPDWFLGRDLARSLDTQSAQGELGLVADRRRTLHGGFTQAVHR